MSQSKHSLRERERAVVPSLTEANVGMWHQWVLERNSTERHKAINELFELAVEGLRARLAASRRRK